MPSKHYLARATVGELEDSLEESRCRIEDVQSLETAILVDVRVTPVDARVYLDDQLVSIGGFRGFVDRSLRYRLIRVVASGHVPWVEAFLPVCDTTIAVVLARHARPTPPPPRPVRVVLHEPDEPPDSEPPSSTDPLAATMIW